MRFARVTLLFAGGVAVLYLAVLAAIFLLQKRAIYPGWWRGTHDVGYDRSAYREIVTVTQDGLRGRLLYAPPRAGMPVILFFHGNGDSVAGSAVAVEAYVRVGYGAVLPEYRGYGDLPGEPSEQGLYRDARAARQWMVMQGIAPARTIVMGYSLGSGVATQSAFEQPPAALVLIAGFASVARVTTMRFAWIPAEWLITEHFDSVAKIGRVTSPVLLVHGDADATVPAANSRLLAAARPGATVIIEPGVGHGIAWKPSAQEKIMEWLTRTIGRS